jgi:hypothetical protein
MPHTKIWSCDDSLNWDFNSQEVLFENNAAKVNLIGLPGQIFSEDFADDTDFAYDSDKAEFVDGKVQTKAYEYADELMGATGVNGKDADRSSTGNETITLAGGATLADISGTNWYDLRGGTSKYIDIPYQNADFGRTGTIRFKIKFPYSGSPASIRNIWQTVGPANANKLLLYHDNSGKLYLRIHTPSGSTQSSFNFGVFSPVANQEYEFETNMEFSTSDVTRHFIDGVKFGGDCTTSVARGAIDSFTFGISTGNTDIIVRDIQVFDTVQHTANFAVEVPREVYNYYGSTVDLPTFVYSGIGSIQSIDNVTQTFSGTPRWITGGYYWNGAAWVVSNGTYAQANTPAEFAANVINFPVAGAGSVTMTLVFPDSDTRCSFDLFLIEITGQQYPSGLVELEQNEAQLCDGIESLENDADRPGTTDILYYVKRQSEILYHDDNDWVASDKSESQLNTLAEILANKDDLGLGSIPRDIKIVPMLKNDGVNTPALRTITMGYNYYKHVQEPNECKVSGYLLNADLTGVEDGEEVRFWFKKPFKHGDNALFVFEKKAATTTKGGKKGWFEIYLPETETIEKVMNADVPYTDSDGNAAVKTYKNLTIPNQSDVDLNTLLGDKA